MIDAELLARHAWEFAESLERRHCAIGPSALREFIRREVEFQIPNIKEVLSNDNK